MKVNEKKFSEAINEALEYSLKKNNKLLCYGLGINDPKRTFSTTQNLVEKFGKKRIFEVPNSENTIMGLAVGAALGGISSVITHQRLDFFLLAMDQLVNSAAKWKYMFGKKKVFLLEINKDNINSFSKNYKKSSFFIILKKINKNFKEGDVFFFNKKNLEILKNSLIKKTMLLII